MDELEAKHEEDYDKGIHPLAADLITPYKELDCEYINKRTSEETSKYEKLLELVNNRLTDIDTRSNVVSSLLADCEDSMTSLNKIDEQVDATPVNSLSSSDVDKLLINLQVIIITYHMQGKHMHTMC